MSDVTDDAFDFNDLSDCYYAVIDVNDYNNYDFLNFLPNLEFLTIIDSSTENKLSCVNGFNFKKKIKINIISSYNDAPFNEERYGFLKDIPYIDLLSLGVEDKTTNVDYVFLQCLRNVHNLKLFLSLRSNFKYYDLTYLDSLCLEGKPYDIALNVSNAVIDELLGAEVILDIEHLDLIRSTNNYINKVVEELNLRDYSSDKEKIDVILDYILTRYTYDKQMQNNYDFSDEYIEQNFYSRGSLTAALEMDTQICGNYAAMMSILCRESGVDSVNIVTDSHAWNAIKIDGYYYFFDSTYIDQSMDDIADKLNVSLKNNSGLFKYSDFYMEDPANVRDHSHLITAVPEVLDVKSVPPHVEYIKINKDNGEFMIDIFNDIFKITFNGKILCLKVWELLYITCSTVL